MLRSKKCGRFFEALRNLESLFASKKKKHTLTVHTMGSDGPSSVPATFSAAFKVGLHLSSAKWRVFGMSAAKPIPKTQAESEHLLKATGKHRSQK